MMAGGAKREDWQQKNFCRRSCCVCVERHISSQRRIVRERDGQCRDSVVVVVYSASLIRHSLTVGVARTCLVVRTSRTGYDANNKRNLTALYICIPIDVNRVCLAGSLGDHSRMSSVGECLVTNKDRLSLSNPLDVLHHGERAANK